MEHAPGRYMFAYKQLRDVFGAEFDALSNTDAALVGRDFLDAVFSDGVNGVEYRRLIGPGNLQSYAECQRVRERMGWDR